MTSTEEKKSNRKKPDQSLEGRVFRQVLIGSFLLGLVLMVIFLALYGQSLASQYISSAFSLVKSTRIAVFMMDVDTDPLIEDIVDIYERADDVSEEEAGSEKYLSQFSQITQRDDYKEIYHIISAQSEDYDELDVYMGVFDIKNDRLIYVCDPDEQNREDYHPGMWESIEEREITKFVNWDGEGKLSDISYMPKYGWSCTSGVPIYHNRDYVGFVFCDVMLTDVIKGVLQVAARYIIGLLIATLAISFFVTNRMRRAFVTPINKIASAAKQFAEDRKNNVNKASHFESLNVGEINEIVNLRDVMNDMEKTLVEYEENMTRITSERERIRTELSLAGRIQSDALPAVAALGERNEFDLDASMMPAKEIGGDFYDFFMIDDDHLCLVIADVSGKGIPASLFMMASKIVIADNAKSGKAPAEILEAANRVITHDNKENMFVTAWVGILEISTGILKAANAGHEYPALKKTGDSFSLYKDRHGLILGGFDEAKYTEYMIRLDPGQSIFIYTDGVPEASDSENRMFGTDRMIAALNKDPEAPSKEILRNVQNSLDEFTNGAERFDDVTMVCLKYLGCQKNAGRIELPAKQDQLEAATDFFNNIMEENGASLKTTTKVDIVIDEIFSNIVRYGYKDHEGTVILEGKVDKGILHMTFMDRGILFNPLNTDSPDITLGADEREIGGLGIFIVRKTMDSLSYVYENGMNILRMSKKL